MELNAGHIRKFAYRVCGAKRQLRRFQQRPAPLQAVKKRLIIFTSLRLESGPLNQASWTQTITIAILARMTSPKHCGGRLVIGI